MIIVIVASLLTMISMAVLWFCLQQAMSSVTEVVTTNWEISGWIPDSTHQLVVNIWNWFPVLVLVGTLIWVYVYAQRRRYRDYYV